MKEGIGDQIKLWALTPANIPEYCEKTGANIDEIMSAYRRTKAENNVLYGFILKEN